MSGRDDNNWVPLAAGLIVGSGVLALLCKMFFTGGRGTYKTIVNQQISAPFECTCKKNSNQPVIEPFSAEEQERRKRKESRGEVSDDISVAGSASGGSGGADSSAPSGSWPWSNSAVWLPLMTGSALLAFLGILYRSFTSGTIGVWLSQRAAGEFSSECGPIMKNTEAMKQYPVCEVTNDETKRKWPRDDRQNPPCDCAQLK